MQHACSACSASFEISDEDLAFYKKVSPVFSGQVQPVPPPTHCPNCRQQRRLAWRNEWTFYRRTCDLCKKPMVSIYEQGAPFPVYCNACWWSDKWNASTYGQEFDFSQPFFHQYLALRSTVPRMTLYLKNGENSDFCNHSNRVRNSYLCVCIGGDSEDGYYSNWVLHSRNICDCYQITESELCYECCYSDSNFRCHHLWLSNECSDAAFLFDCTGCRDCFCCWNLRHKQYCIENKQYSKEEYESRMRDIQLTSYSQLQHWKQRYLNLIKEKAVRKAQRTDQCQNCDGDFLYKSKNVRDSYDILHSEDCRYCYASERLKDCYDVNEAAFRCELQCDSQSCDTGNRVLYSHVSFEVDNVLYVDGCFNSSHMFGCVGMRRAKYCILNKQYSQEEYEVLVLKIIEHMRQHGEWGEYFPVSLSPFAYNETAAMEWYPLGKKAVEAKGWQWKERRDEMFEAEKIIPAEQLPDDIAQVPDDILNWAVRCQETQRPFRIIKQELTFYRDMNLPLPRLHPDERRRQRMTLSNPRKLWERACAKCDKKIKTSYAPERPETVYCEECYLSEVY